MNLTLPFSHLLFAKLRSVVQEANQAQRVAIMTSIPILLALPAFAQDIATIEEGIYEIRPLSDTTKALDAGISRDTDGLGKDGDNVKQWESFGNRNQRWEITSVGDGYYRVSPRHNTNFGLDASGTTPGSTVRVWTYEGKPNQQWQFYEDSIYYEIAPRSIVEGEDVPALRLDVVGGKTTNNANIQLYTDNNSTAQRWYLYRTGDIGDEEPDPVLSIGDEVDEVEMQRLVVYPNPSYSEIKWQRPTGEPATLLLHTVQGQLILKESVIGPQGVVSTAQLPRGTYLLTLLTANQQFRQQLLVE